MSKNNPPPPIKTTPSVDWVDSSDSDDTSAGGDDDIETPHSTTTFNAPTRTNLEVQTIGRGDGINNRDRLSVTLTSEEYSAVTIRQEFKKYQSVLPRPHELLQKQHSFIFLREMITKAAKTNSQIEMPRFLKTQAEGGIKPHYALCCLLLDELQGNKTCLSAKGPSMMQQCEGFVASLVVRFLSFGLLYPANHAPADVIREQFNRIAHIVPKQLIRPSALRKKIRDRSLPIPNFFLDPEDDKQFPPHVALIVILQDGEKESRHFGNPIYIVMWSAFSFLALVLRLVLEVIGGAGAIWGGSEVFGLRHAHNKEMWRWLSIGVGILCFLRFATLNVPQKEDEGDILGPAGPWSLRPASRLRAVTSHPFHYFVRAQAPYSPPAEIQKKKN